MSQPNDYVGELLRVTQYFTVLNQIQECNTTYRCSATAGGGSTLGPGAGSLSSTLSTAWRTYNTAVNNTGTTYYGTSMRAIATVGSLGWSVNPPNNILQGFAGALAVQLLPTQCRPLISFNSLLIGRKNRGRIYLPTPDASMLDVATDLWIVVMLNAMNALGTVLAATQILTVGPTTTTWIPVIAHIPKHALLPTVNFTATDVAGFTRKTRVATQRRSGLYGRSNPPPF